MQHSRITYYLLSMAMVVFVAIYSIYMGVKSFYTPYETETAFSDTVHDTIAAPAVALRAETVMAGTPGDTIHYLQEDGSLLLPDTVVAQVFSTKDGLYREHMRLRYRQEAEILEDAQRVERQNLSVRRLRTELVDVMGSLTEAAAQKNLQQLTEQRHQLTTLFAKISIATGEANGIAERVRYLRTEEAKFSPMPEEQIQEIRTPTGGYFCGSIDGYESILHAESLATRDPIDYVRAIQGTLPATPTPAYGKLQEGHDWFLAAQVTAEQRERFSIGDTVFVDFSLDTYREVPATVVHTSTTSQGDSLVFLRVNYLNDALIRLRRVNLNISFGTYSGLRVPKEALRYQEQIEGVYVKTGNLVSFCPIERSYTGESFVLCRAFSEVEPPYTALKLFDEVIVRGADLYHGKII